MGILDLQPKAPTKIDAIFLDPDVPQEYKDHLFVALVHPMIAHADIHRELLNDGYSIGETTIKNYRKKLSHLIKSSTGD